MHEMTMLQSCALHRGSSRIAIITAGAILLLALNGCANMEIGSRAAKTAATGSAGGANAEDANNTLARCDEPFGTIAVVEDTSAPWYGILTSQRQLGPTTPVLKLLVQQSNCFVVVDRGRAMGNLMQERALQQSGELRAGSNFGKGQLVAADYTLSPSITFSNNDAGQAGMLVGGLLGPIGAIVGAGLSAKEASTLLTLVDGRSGVQVAVAEGSAKNWDVAGLGVLVGGGAAGLGGGYSNTAEGKVIVAAFVDSYNGIVKAVKNYRAQTVRGSLGTGGQLAVQGAGADRNSGVSESRSRTVTLKEAQERLNELGFAVGKPDGVMGPRTRSQIRAFQKSRGIPTTGELDSATGSELLK